MNKLEANNVCRGAHCNTKLLASFTKVTRQAYSEARTTAYRAATYVLLLVGMSNSRQGVRRGPGKQILDSSNLFNIEIFQGTSEKAWKDKFQTFLRLWSGYRRLFFFKFENYTSSRPTRSLRKDDFRLQRITQSRGPARRRPVCTTWICRVLNFSMYKLVMLRLTVPCLAENQPHKKHDKQIIHYKNISR